MYKDGVFVIKKEFGEGVSDKERKRESLLSREKESFRE